MPESQTETDSMNAYVPCKRKTGREKRKIAPGTNFPLQSAV